MDNDINLMNELLKSRDLIESSLRQSIRELEQLGIEPEESLVDSEGYPRVDIDLYRVTALKSSIARQLNDYKEIMRRIEILLPKVLPAQNYVNSVDRMAIVTEQLAPFAKIGLVPTGSQAFQAGLCSGDLILKFGDLTRETFHNKDLSLFANELARFKASGSILEIKIMRTDKRSNSIKIDCKIVETLGCQILLL